MAKIKHTTPRMTASERLKSWLSGKCPYCGCTNTKRTEVTKGEFLKGLHYRCLNDDPNNKCGAQNYFSDKRLLQEEGVIS